jgi:UPF0176 protein
MRQDLVSDAIADWGVNPTELTGTYLTADELHSWYESGKPFYLIDVRNEYEHASGSFEGALFPPIENFRDLPKTLSSFQHLTDRPIVTVCTGGVRCEKASGLLLKHGFQEVYQLKDGIVTYLEKYPNQHFKGKVYVFDQRLLLGFQADDPKHEIVGRCRVCQTPCEHYTNCTNQECHRQIICCDACFSACAPFTCSHGGLTCLD